VSSTLVCSEDDCPVATELRCLEGFDPPDTCPNARFSSEAEDGGDDRARVEREAIDEDVDEDDEPASSPPQRWVNLGGDVALTPSESDQLAERHPCRLVLVAGEFESGKTTLLVELYARFLLGPFAGADFGGSATLRALDARHHPARENSGRAVPKTERTQDEDMRLLHLRVRRHGRLHDLLFSDIKGEFFEAIADRADAIGYVPLAARADVCLVLVDGAAIADVRRRQTAVTRARLLLGGLADPDGLQPGTKTVIVLTKVDLIDSSDRSWAEVELGKLRERALDLGLDGAAVSIAARPHEAQPEGLEQILDHVIPLPRRHVTAMALARPGDRQFWNQPDAAP
jgi:hypothetical protein